MSAAWVESFVRVTLATAAGAPPPSLFVEYLQPAFRAAPLPASSTIDEPELPQALSARTAATIAAPPTARCLIFPPCETSSALCGLVPTAIHCSRSVTLLKNSEMMPSHRPSWLNGSNVDLSGEAVCPELASYSWRRSCSPYEIPRAGDIPELSGCMIKRVILPRATRHSVDRRPWCAPHIAAPPADAARPGSKFIMRSSIHL